MGERIEAEEAEEDETAGRVIPFAYQTVDAAFVDLLASMRNLASKDHPIVARRTTISAGSSRYAISIGKVKVPGSLFIRSVGPERTYCIVEAAKTEIAELLKAWMDALIDQIYDDKAIFDRLSEQETATQRASTDNDALHTALAHVQSVLQTALAPAEPEKGDPIEVWLEWRDQVRDRTGRTISLSRIAALSSHSLSTLKKRSAKRNRQDKEEPK